MNLESFRQSKIIVVKHSSKKTLLFLKKIINKNFNIYDDNLNLSDFDYRNKVLYVQDEINNAKCHLSNKNWNWEYTYHYYNWMSNLS